MASERLLLLLAVWALACEESEDMGKETEKLAHSKKEMSQSADFVICGSLFGAQARKARKNSVELGSAQLALML